MSNHSNFKKIWDLFCKTTSIHGFPHLHKSKDLCLKGFWVIVILTMLSLSIWLCWSNVLIYSRFDTQTQITYETETEIQFPSITFRNQFVARRSKTHSNPLLLIQIVGLLVDKAEDVARVMEESRKTCNINVTIPSVWEFWKLAGMTLTDLMESITEDSFQNLVKCWWAGEEFDCNGRFENHHTDRSTAFTYIPMRSVFQNLEITKYQYYGLNKSMIIDRNDSTLNSKSGLQLLLNTHQNEHCDSSRKYEGVGFQAVVHDSLNLFPSFALISSISLKPGYVHTVSLKPTVFKRNTADLPTKSKCNRRDYAGPKGVYFQHECVQVCFLKRIVDKCKCIPFTFFKQLTESDIKYFISYVKTFSKLDVDRYLHYLPCPGTRSVLEFWNCIKQQEYATYKGENILGNCPECIQACEETGYEYLVSQQKFSDHSLQNDFDFLSPNRTNRSEEIKKNFVLVNFILESLTVIHVIESQKFTMSNLIIYMGGVVGLFLGMSFMSFGDIWQLLAFEIENWIKKLYHLLTKINRLHNIFSKKTTKVQIMPSSVRRTNVNSANVREWLKKRYQKQKAKKRNTNHVKVFKRSLRAISIENMNSASAGPNTIL